MAKPNRIKTDAVPAPATQDQAEELLAQIGRMQRQVANIEGEMNNELSAIKQKFEQQAQPVNSEIEAKFHALHIWAEANRSTILKGRSKTAKLATGELQWRVTPKKVSIRGQDTVIETLKRLGMSNLVRSKEEVNKEAILLDEKKVSGINGISISQREEFVAKPFESNIERAEPVKKAA